MQLHLLSGDCLRVFITQAARHKFFASETPEVRGLADHLREHLAAVGKHGTVIHIAHSHGALITYLCTRHLTVLERARIKIISIGGARSLSEKDFGSAINYYTTNEPMLYVDYRASKALKLLQVQGRASIQHGVTADSRPLHSPSRLIVMAPSPVLSRSRPHRLLSNLASIPIFSISWVFLLRILALRLAIRALVFRHPVSRHPRPLGVAGP
jgi:hypothetical protein